MGLSELFTSVSGVPVGAAASRFAAAGVPVFPCVPGAKIPLTPHGFLDATTDAGEVVSWWRRWPNANLGVPTGAASGVEVVDVDRKATGSGFAGFEDARQAGLLPSWLAEVRTPSGGMHAYYPTGAGGPQPSWQAARAHVDFRGAGGYVIVPPSMVEIADGVRGRYEFLGGAQPEPRPVDAAALRDFLDPRTEPTLPRHAPGGVQDAVRLAGWVAGLDEGERNRGLFWAACRLAESGATPAATLAALGAAAERAGLPPQEVLVTVRSAYRTTSTTRAQPSRSSDVAPRAVAVNPRVLS